MAAFWAVPARAQTAEVKEKPPMYSYIGFWNIPRAQWAEIEKSNAANKNILDKAIANGTLVGYGFDMNLVHQPDGSTHDDWWSAMSMAGVLNVLDQFYKSGSPTSPVLASATKHMDCIFVSRYYNWHSGSWKDLYTHGASFKLKPNAPDNALDIAQQEPVRAVDGETACRRHDSRIRNRHRSDSHRSAWFVLAFLHGCERGRPGQGHCGNPGCHEDKSTERPGI